MALKAKIKKAAYDKLSAELKAEYVEDGEDFKLDVEGLEDTGALKRAKDREVQLRQDVEAERDELKQTVATLEKGNGKDVVKLQKKYDGDIQAIKDEHAGVLAKRDAFIVQQLKGGLAERLSTQLNPKSPKVFIPHLESRITVDLTGDEPKVVILGADGKPSKLTPDQLHAEFVANKDFAGMIVKSQASGGAGPQHNSPAGGAGNGNRTEPPQSLATMKPGDLASRIKATKEGTT